MKIKIIQLKGPDRIDEVKGLFNRYMMFYKKPSDEMRYREFLYDRLARGEAIVLLALNEYEEPMGFVLNYPSFSTLSQEKIIILNDLFVLEDYREMGVAKALINAVFVFAAAGNYARVDLSTGKSNIAAGRLYGRLGFTKVTGYDFYSYTFKK